MPLAAGLPRQRGAERAAGLRRQPAVLLAAGLPRQQGAERAGEGAGQVGAGLLRQPAGERADAGLQQGQRHAAAGHAGQHQQRLGPASGSAGMGHCQVRQAPETGWRAAQPRFCRPGCLLRAEAAAVGGAAPAVEARGSALPGTSLPAALQGLGKAGRAGHAAAAQMRPSGAAAAAASGSPAAESASCGQPGLRALQLSLRLPGVASEPGRAGSAAHAAGAGSCDLPGVRGWESEQPRLELLMAQHAECASLAADAARCGQPETRA